MGYESVKSAAERMGVTSRAIQKWAKEGRLPGAYFDNRVWWIPDDIKEPLKTNEVTPKKTVTRYQLPLLRCSFNVGEAMKFIESIPDPDDKNIALAEYYYYRGQAEEAAQLLQQYFDSDDESLRYSANVMCTFANIFRGHIHLAGFFSERVSKELEQGLKNQDAPKELNAIGVLTAYIGKYLLNVPVPDVPPLEEYLHFLPNGIRLYGAYTFRAQTDFVRTFSERHQVEALAGFEFRQSQFKSHNTLLMGYDEQSQTNNMGTVNIGQLKALEGSTSALGSFYTMYGAPTGNDYTTSDVLHRFYSIYFNGNYTFDSRYSASLSYRVDKAAISPARELISSIFSLISLFTSLCNACILPERFLKYSVKALAVPTNCAFAESLLGSFISS